MVVVQFDSVLAFPPVRIAPTFGSDAPSHDRFGQALVSRAQDLGNGLSVPFGDGVFQQRDERASFDGLRSGDVREGGQGGVDVHELDDASAGLSIALGTGGLDNERCPCALFEEGALLPDSIVFTQMVAMVAPKYDDGIFRQVEPLEGVEHPSDLGVDERHAGIVGLHGLAAGQFVQVVMRNRAIMGEGGGGYVLAIVSRGIGQTHVFQGI